MDDEIFTLILQAKNEASAALEQMRADVSRMAADIEKSNIIAGQSFAQLNQQTEMMARSIASTATAASTHATTINGSLSAAARDVSSSFKQVESDFASLRGTLLNAAILTAPLAIVGGDALHMAGDYEAAMNKIRGLTSATKADIALWGPAMIEMSKNGTKSADELAAAMYFVASTGLHGADALHVLDEAQQASTGGLGRMDVIANALGGTLNAYVAQAERASKATEYMDKITQAVVMGHMNPETLAPALSRVTPIAAAAGVPVEDVLAALATETHIGGSVDQGATGLRAIITTLMAPGAGSQKALADMGIDPTTIGKRLREEGLQQTLADIDAASLAEAGGDKDVQDAILKKLFPQARTALPVMLALTRTGGDIDSGGGDANFFKQIDTSITNNSSGVTAKANQTALEGFNAQMAELKNRVDAVGIAFGQQLLPGLKAAVQDFGPALIGMLTQLANDAIRVGETIGAMGSAFGALAGAVGVSIDPLRVVEGLLIGMAAFAFISVGAAIGGLLIDIGALVFSLGGLAMAFLTMDAAAVGAAVASATAWIAAAAPIVGVIALGALLVVAWSNDWLSIQEVVHNAITFIADHIGIAIGFLSPFMALPGLIKEAWDQDFGGIREIFAGFINFIAGLVDKLGALVPAEWKTQWDNARQAVADAMKGVTDHVGGAADAVGSKVAQIGDAIAKARAALDHLQSPDVIGTADYKAQVDKIMTDLQKQQADITNGTQLPGTDTTGAPNAAAQEKTALERELLDLKRQSLVIEGDMIGPQQHLRDLQLEMRDAAKEQQKLADEKRLLDLDAKDFNQNADLKRIDLQIKHDQENLNFTRSPAEAGALKADIERLQRQAHGIRAGLFPDDNARLEAELAQSGDALNVKLAQNAINQQIAIVNDSLKPDEAKKRAFDDAIKLIGHQQAVDKLNAELNPSAPTIPITPRGGASGPNSFVGGGGTIVFQPGAIQVDVHNPVLTSDQTQADAVAIFRKGLDEAIAAGTELPHWTGAF